MVKRLTVQWVNPIYTELFPPGRMLNCGYLKLAENIKPGTLQEGKDYYINKDGLLVFTGSYLKARGYCCGNGCMNCPYDYMNVPEAKRTQLLQKRLTDERGKAEQG
jgi:hypothetical protein